ncbi:protein JASON-like [Bidens hawaiensis]|uniref:protein JASON-like n=1 Tax=Bidens hawaiensis TaxID=980011 RepID=UPI00404B63A7
MASLHRKLFEANLQVDSRKEQITILNAKTGEVELGLSKRKVTVDKFEIASDKLNGIIGSQIGVKQKTGIGHENVAIPPAFNENYTSLPHFSFNTPLEDKMVYGIGHILKPKIFVPKVPKNVGPIFKPDSYYGSSLISRRMWIRAIGVACGLCLLMKCSKLLVISDEDEDLSKCEDGRYGDDTGSSYLDEELRAEAKFLKACGTLPQTPAEIRKTKKSQDSQSHNEDTESTFNSNIPNSGIEDTLQKHPDQLQSPITVFQKWDNGSDSSSRSSNSTSVESYEIGPVASTKYKNKSVHFESLSDSSKNSSPNIINPPVKLTESPFDHTISKPTPYPTPLKLTDDMQTPGTVFPSYGKTRAQYLNSGINPINFCQFDTPIEEECIEESPQSELKLQESSNKKELNECPTLSSWLPPKSTHDEDCIDPSLPSQTPGDRVILGVINSDWNADETPKWGDVNGIPNTTNKYSKDQKVKWHATPFEERLEKALLEEKFILKMQQLGGTSCVEF